MEESLGSTQEAQTQYRLIVRQFNYTRPASFRFDEWERSEANGQRASNLMRGQR